MTDGFSLPNFSHVAAWWRWQAIRAPVWRWPSSL
jgi:hypothetical protein